MKITSLNLAGYKDWPNRKPNIISYLEEQNSDIVFLQEVKYDRELSPHTQSKQLNSKLSTPYPYASSSVSRYHVRSDGTKSKEGLATLSKYPIINSESLALTKQPDDKHTRIIQTVSLEINDSIAIFTNVHFSNNKYSFDQLAETLRILKDSGDKGIILGDFNIFDINEVRDLYSSEYIVSADFKQYISFPSEGVTLDYVLMPHGHIFESLSVGENLSDHNALTFEFSVL